MPHQVLCVLCICVCVCARLNATAGIEVSSLLWACRGCGAADCCPRLHVETLTASERPLVSVRLVSPPPQIDAERSPDEVFAQICQAMETFWFLQSQQTHPPPPTPPNPTQPSAVQDSHLWRPSLSLSLSFCYITTRRLTPTPPPSHPPTHTCTRHIAHWTPVVCMSHLMFWNTPQQSVKLSLCPSTLTKRPVVTSCFTHSRCLSLSLSLTLTSIYAANCRTEADNRTEKNSIPCCDWEHVSKLNVKSLSPPPSPPHSSLPPSQKGAERGFPPRHKVEMSVCAHALMHSIVFYIVTSMQELQSSLTLPFVRSIKSRKELSIEEYRICMFPSSSYRWSFELNIQ